MSDLIVKETRDRRKGAFKPSRKGVYCTVGAGKYLSRMDPVNAAHAHNQGTKGLYELWYWYDCACKQCTSRHAEDCPECKETRNA